MEATQRFQISASLMTMSLMLLTNTVAGHQLYNASSDMCCDGTVQARNGSAIACCGSTGYDPSESKCCMEQVVPLPAERGFRHGCCMGQAQGNVSAFSFDTHVCCDGVLLEKPDRNGTYGCLGAELYNATESMLCGDSLVAREAGRGCCVAEPYDFENQTCCTLVERSEGPTGISTTTSFQIHRRPHPGQGCCGIQLYNQTDQVCCDGRVRPRPADVPLAVCCGDAIITNYTAQICCRGRILERPSENHTCCESGVFDFRQEVCCGEEVLTKDSGRACCPGAGRSFNATTEFCCQSEVVAIDANATDTAACCGEPVSRGSVLSFL